ncbi:MAG: AAA family ATPase [Magnetococcus sp. YQC-5]
MKTIVFYSFKGGVGRTALMLHLGVHWADRGRVVALVDMDLQAPGLSFHPWLVPLDKESVLHNLGVSDLLATFYETRDIEKRTFTFFPPSRFLREMKPGDSDSKGKWGSDGRLLVLPAGDVTIPQMQVVEDAETISIPSAKASLEDSLDQQAMRTFAQKFIQDLEQYRVPDHPRKAGIDYLLIDCRTGYPELVELTMGYMADRLVLVSGLNQQNLRGLGITLKKLRPQRVVRGRYASELLVAFSPVPAHFFEDPAVRMALEQGVKVLQEHRLPGDESEPEEILPPYFFLPYSPHLVASDTPIPRTRFLGKLHPYWDVVEQIAEMLDSTKTLQDATQEVLRQARDVMGLDFSAGDAGQTMTSEDREGSLVAIPTSRRGSQAIMWQRPKWHWPLADDPQKIDAWLHQYPDWYGQREQFLDGLCASISLSIEEKERIVKNWNNLSQFQVDSLVKLFQDEQLRFSAQEIWNDFDMMTQLFQHQQQWAEFMLGKESGREAFLLRPLRDQHLFVSWKESFYYWFVLADALEKEQKFSDDVITARQKAIDIAMENPWESLASLKNDQYINQDLAEKMLDRILAKSLSNDQNLCYDLCRKILGFWPEALAEKITPIVDHLRKVAPDWEATHYIHAWLCSVSRKFNEEEKALRQLIAIDLKNVFAWDRLGELFMYELDQYAESEAAFRQVIAIYPEYVKIWNNLGKLFRDHLDRDVDSEAAYRKAIAINSNVDSNVDAWNGLGILYWNKLGKCQEALHCFGQGLAIKPHHPYILKNRGHLRLLLGQDWQQDLQDALFEFEKNKGCSVFCNQMFLSLELSLVERLPKEDDIAKALARWHYDVVLIVMVAMRDLSMDREIQPKLEQAVVLLNSYDKYYFVMYLLHLLAGARPDLRERVRQAAAFFFHLAPEHLSRFKDVPRPALLERYRDFVEGRSDGAGDPRERHLFCKDAPPPAHPSRQAG